MDAWGSFLMYEIRDFPQVGSSTQWHVLGPAVQQLAGHTGTQTRALGESVWGEWLGFDIQVLISVQKKSFPPLHIYRQEKMPMKLYFFFLTSISLF